MIQHTKKVCAAADQIAFGISTVLLVAVAVLGVFFRFVLNNPIPWIEEIEMILVVWATFFGGSIAIRERGHIAVDILFDMFPAWARKALDIATWFIITIAIAFIMKLEIDRVIELVKSALRTPVLQIPSYIEYTGVAIACGLMLLNHLIYGIEEVFAKKEKGVSKHE